MRLRECRRGALAATGAVALLAGCNLQVEGMVMYGTPKSVAVRYYGDLANATGPAQQYCAQYGRSAEYVTTADNLAQFDCVAR